MSEDLRISHAELIADAEKRNWTEDFSHENGNYHCRCCICNNYFIGHKRRVVCKKCAEPHVDLTDGEGDKTE